MAAVGLLPVAARAAGEAAPCPACGAVSARVHSRYARRLADAPVRGRPSGMTPDGSGSSPPGHAGRSAYIAHPDPSQASIFPASSKQMPPNLGFWG